MFWSFDKILKEARRHSATDIHLIRGLAPALRVKGEIYSLKGAPLEQVNLEAMLSALLTDKQRQILEKDWHLCFSRHWPEVGRFRASVYYHAGCPEMAIRLCDALIPSREELSLPAVIDELTRKPDGLVLVAGPTGMGKTNTLNYMIDVINRERRAKIVTVEDPVEYVHENQRSIVVQQEVYTDTPSFQQALTHVLRQDPDVIVIGEMRELETMALALTAAETGHLVLATLHTPDIVQAIQRIHSVFPPEQQNHIMFQLANCLQGIIAQNLLARANNNGRILACEICLATPGVRKQLREGNPHMLHNEMLMGKRYQMQTMDTALQDLYQRGEITLEVAQANAREPNAIRQRVSPSGRTEP